jgi:hypothetical protein
LSIRFGQRSPEDSEVLREDEDLATVDQSMTGDKAVAIDHVIFHTEVPAAVTNEFVELLEGALIQKKLNPLPGRQLAFAVLAFLPLGPATRFGAGMPPPDFLQSILAHGLSLVPGHIIAAL